MRNLVISCFSGAGGMDLGLEAAGFESAGCIELDSLARETLEMNRPQWPVLEIHDVVEAGKKLEPSDLDLKPRELTLLAGGPPCQPFSMAAQWQKPKPGMEDSRGSTVMGMLNIAEKFLPEAILIENVAGFLRGKNSAAEAIRDRLDEINEAHGTHYKLHHWILNAADYGVPQNRRRAIAVSFRDLEVPDDLMEPPAPFAGDHRTAWDAIGEMALESIPKAEGGYADLLPSIPEGGNYQYLTAKGGGEKVELFGYRTRYWSFLLKLRRDAPAWTLPASPGPSTGPFHWDNRPLAVKERLALQGMDVNWKLAGGPRDAVKLTGNATPSPLAESIGRYILHMIRNGGQPPTPSDVRPALAVEKRGLPPIAADPLPLPLEWRAKVSPRSAHPGAGEGPAGHKEVVDE